jgi:hypothetical protein
MNAYPPPVYVSRGVYHLLAHPIYVGFCFVCWGIAIVTHSVSGFWLVSPIVALGCIALVYGYESPNLMARFGEHRPLPLIRLPLSDSARPSLWNRLSVYVLVILPWLLAGELVAAVNSTAQAPVLWFPLHHGLGSPGWTSAILVSAYLWVLLAPIVARTRDSLREFAVFALLATLVGGCMHLLLPNAAFPALYLIWAMLCARLTAKSFPRLKVLWYLWAVAIGVSGVTTDLRTILDPAIAVATVILIWSRHGIWKHIRQLTERLANSWREWRIGPVRIINHSIFAALAGLTGLLLVSSLLPESSALAPIIVALASLLGGALFAQWVEGSSKLLRPFGYFGAIIGGLIGVGLASAAVNINGWLLLGAFAVAAPAIQAIGRVRCIIQGCCHGRPTSVEFGVKHWHPSSRVTHISGLANTPVHATALYSIFWNIVIAAVLLRLWFLGVPANLITGLYFILAGCGRFVEESYRGETQTRIVGGLRIYHWFSVGSVVFGILVSSIPGPQSTTHIAWRWGSLLPALVGGLLSGIAMSVDLPASHKRFARLTG